MAIHSILPKKHSLKSKRGSLYESVDVVKKVTKPSKEKETIPSFRNFFLSLLLIIGLFEQGTFVSKCSEQARTWNLFGPDRSGSYGGAQGIGGLEATYNEATGTTAQVINNFFGDTIASNAPINGAIASNATGSFTRYNAVLGGYGPMPGSILNIDLHPQWRGKYEDWTGLIYMGARYYEPVGGRFLSADPLGHEVSMDLYSYCNGDPVNGLDPDGRCVEGAAAGWSNGDGAFAGTYDPSQASSELSYGAGWTVGGALGDINAMVARPVALGTAAVTGAGLWGINSVMGALDEKLGGAGAVEAAGFMLGSLLGAEAVELRACGDLRSISGIETTENSSRELSLLRYTQDGETYLRYESANSAFSRITPQGVAPATFAAPVSDGIVPLEERAGKYNLPNPEILRTKIFILRPPAGTPIIGPRSVIDGTGNEVVFPNGY